MRVIADSGLVPLATTLAEAAEPPREWLGLGRLDLTPLTLVVTADADGFARWSGGRIPRWGAGLTLPARRIVVIRADAGDPVGTLRHELAHLALHLTVPGRVPLWFAEGYAVVAAGEHGRLAALQLNLAVAMGRVPTLRALDGHLRGLGGGDAATAYALAGAAVLELQRVIPGGTLEPLLTRLREGEPFETALQAAAGRDLASLEAAWHSGVRARYNLGIWVLTGGAWAVLALLLGVAAVWRRRADAPRRAALDHGWPMPPVDDDSMTANDGSMTTVTKPADALDQPGVGR